VTRPDPAKIADPVTRDPETQFHLCRAVLRALCTGFLSVLMKQGPSDSGSDRVQTPRGRDDKAQRMFWKYTSGDDQMDAAEFAKSLKEILGKGMRSGAGFGVQENLLQFSDTSSGDS